MGYNGVEVNGVGEMGETAVMGDLEEQMMAKFFLFILSISFLIGCQPDTSLEAQATNTPSMKVPVEREVTPTPEVVRPTEVATIAPVTPMPTPTFDWSVLPDYLGNIIPAPYGAYSLETYQQLAPGTNWGILSPGICFAFEPHPLMEPGDFMTKETILNRISFFVNRNRIEQRTVARVNLPEHEHWDLETGELLWTVPGGFPALLCYKADLGVGEYFVTIVFEKTSGQEESYTWSFVITE